MTEPTDADYRACIDSLLPLYQDLRGKFEVEPDVQVKFQSCFPLAMMAINQIYAATKLADLDREFLASANVRVAYEHAVTAQWVMYTEGAEKLMVATMKRSNRLAIESIAKHVELPEGFLAGFGRDGDKTMPPFEQRCAALEGKTGSLYFYYRSMSEAVHPSTATLAQHLVFDDDGNPRGLNFGAAEPPPGDVWMVAALSALASAFVIEALRKGQPRLQRVVDLANSVDMPVSLWTAGLPESD